MDNITLAIIVLNSMALPVLAFALWNVWLAKKELADSKKMLDDVGKAASESSKSQAVALRDLSDKVATLNLRIK